MYRKSIVSNQIIDFNKSVSYIYIYGAGMYGKVLYESCKLIGVSISGFITTEYEKDEYCGEKVFSMSRGKEFLKAESGVIVAFYGANEKKIKSLMGKGTKVLFINLDLLHIEYKRNLLTFIANDLMRSKLDNNVLEINNRESFLIVRLDAIGDVVCTTALIRELRQNRPDAEITVLIQKQNEGLLKECPYIDRLVLYNGSPHSQGAVDTKEYYLEIKEDIREFVKKYLNEAYSAIFLAKDILLGNNAYEDLLVCFECKAKKRYGKIVTYNEYLEMIYEVMHGCFDNLIRIDKPMHESLYQLEMLKANGMQINNTEMEIYYSEVDNDFEYIDLKEKEKNIYIAVGIVGNSGNRNWSVKNYIELTLSLNKFNGREIYFMVFGGPDAESSANELSEFGKNVISFAGILPLEKSVAYMDMCDMYIGSNTGLMHIAAALKKPCVTVYAFLPDGSSFDANGPIRYGINGVNHIDLFPKHALGVCSGMCAINSHCINQISVKEVMYSIKKLLEL